jgi:hypothetical protein
VVIRTAILLLVALLLAPPATRADLIELYGAENVGTSGGQLLKIPVGPRAVAMGRAQVACAIEGSAAFWNPAGVMRTAGRRNLFASHVEYTTDIGIDYASVNWRGQNFGYALTAGMLRSGEIPRTTELHAEGTGQTFRADQYILGFSLARSMTDRMSVGVTAKYLQENLDEWETRALLFDIGMLYYLGVRDISVGVAIRGLGSDLRPSGSPPIPGPEYEQVLEFQSSAPPTEGTFGVAGTWDLSRNVDLLTAVDFHHPSDARESLRTGLELGIRRLLYLRAGFESGRDEGGFGAGFGLQLKRKQMLWRIDYAYSDMGAFGTIHHVGVEFSPLWSKETRRHGRVR